MHACILLESLKLDTNSYLSDSLFFTPGHRLGALVFPSPQKPTFLNSNKTTGFSVSFLFQYKILISPHASQVGLQGIV